MEANETQQHAAAEAMYNYVTPSVAALGMLGNVLALVVWTKESAFNSAIFLIKCLAVADLFFLTMNILGLIQIHPTSSELVFSTCIRVASIYGRIFSVHLTLALVFTRWLAVFRPFQTQALLTKRRTVVGTALLMLWCMVVGLPFLLANSGFLPSVRTIDGTVHDLTAYNIIITCTQGLSLVLPIVVLVIFNVSIAYIMCRQRGDSTLGQQQNRARATQLKRLLSAVVCVSVTTVLAYPMGLIADLTLYFFLDNLEASCGKSCAPTILSIADFLEVVNSSINVVYYIVFASHFRELLYARFHCGRKNKRPEGAPPEFTQVQENLSFALSPEPHQA